MRQTELGVPFVELFGGPTNDLSSYLGSVVGTDFWSWIDSASETTGSDLIKVHFRKWSDDATGFLSLDQPRPQFQHLQLSSFMSEQGLSTLDALGYEAHQALRTGSNEVFYMSRDGGDPVDRYVATVTKNGKLHSESIKIPPEFVIAAIRKLPSNSPLLIREVPSKSYLLNLSDAVLPEDKKWAESYPSEWKTSWKIDHWKIISDPLASYLRGLENMTYEGKGAAQVRVAQLSAVRTNVYLPTKKGMKMPSRPRFWYQIPLQRRHFGEIILPRVSGGPIRAFLVENLGSIVIDANFTTILSKRPNVPRTNLWTWFNSNTFRILCETNGVVLGGGALKVEAVLVSRLPVPIAVREAEERKLADIMSKLARGINSEKELIWAGEQIDEVLFGQVIAASNERILRERVTRRAQ